MEKSSKLHTPDSGILPFDPIVVLLDVAKHWLVVVLIALIAGVGSYIVTDLTHSPAYKTTVTFVVTDHSSSSTVYTNLSTTNSLASVFSELMNSSILRKEILKQIGESSFDGSISASVISETNLLTVSVTSSSPRSAFLVAQALIDHHAIVTSQVVDGVSLEVLQKPTVPVSPYNRVNTASTVKSAVFLAAAAAILLLAMKSYLQDTVRSAAEARRKLDCKYLGEIPHERKYTTLLSMVRRQKSSILVSSPMTTFGYVENIRKLQHRVEQNIREGKILMVTSLLENEGKSTIAVNLALSMARKHAKVLLIDCDLRKPACHLLLEQNTVHKGLRDVLAGKASVSAALLKYKNGNLDMLLEKRSFGNSNDLISSENMQTLICWARDEYDFVILDLPPMAAASDAEVMMEFADASLLVVRQNAAPVPSINKAIASLKSGKARLLGCVVNNVYASAFTATQSYGYDHYRKYSKHGAYRSKK